MDNLSRFARLSLRAIRPHLGQSRICWGLRFQLLCRLRETLRPPCSRRIRTWLSNSTQERLARRHLRQEMPRSAISWPRSKPEPVPRWRVFSVLDLRGCHCSEISVEASLALLRRQMSGKWRAKVSAIGLRQLGRRPVRHMERLQTYQQAITRVLWSMPVASYAKHLILGHWRPGLGSIQPLLHRRRLLS